MSSLMIPVLLIAGFPVFIYMYALLRWRAGNVDEPGQGSFALVLMFRMMATLLAVGCVAALLYSARSEEQHKDLNRVCWGLLVGSVIFLGLQFLLGALLQPSGRFDAARRLFGGGLVGVAGIVTLMALLAYVVGLFQEVREHQKESHAEFLRVCSSVLLCFGATYVTSSVTMALPTRRAIP
jgi:Ca2+/H+ antiporter